MGIKGLTNFAHLPTFDLQYSWILTMKQKFTLTAIIDAPLEDVFEYAVNLANYSAWTGAEAIAEQTSSKIGRDVEFKEVHYHMNQTHVIPVKITQFDSYHYWTQVASSEALEITTQLMFQVHKKKFTKIIFKGQIDIFGLPGLNILNLIFSGMSAKKQARESLRKLIALC